MCARVSAFEEPKTPRSWRGILWINFAIYGPYPVNFIDKLIDEANMKTFSPVFFLDFFPMVKFLGIEKPTRESQENFGRSIPEFELLKSSPASFFCCLSKRNRYIESNKLP